MHSHNHTCGANAKGTHLKSPIGVHIFAKRTPHKNHGNGLAICSVTFVKAHGIGVCTGGGPQSCT